MSFWKQEPPKPYNKMRELHSQALIDNTYDGRLEELGAHSSVLTDSVGDLINVGTSSLTDGREGVNRGDSLGQHGVGSELGKLRRPEADSQNSLLRNPVGVDVRKSLAGIKTLLGLERSNKDSVRAEKIGDSSTLGKELCTLC